MSKFKNYVNPISKTNNIYSLEDLCNMTLYNVSDNLETLKAQNKTIGFPFNEELQASSNVVYVEAYTRSDGTLVHAHWRSKPQEQNNQVRSNSQNDSLNKEYNNSTQILNGEISKQTQRIRFNNLIDKLINNKNENKNNIIEVSKTLLKYRKESSHYYKQYENIKNSHEKEKYMFNFVKNYSTKEYIKPTSLSNNYDTNTFFSLRANYELNKNRPDAQELFRIAILGTNSYSNNSQFVHIPKIHIENIQAMFELDGNDMIPNYMNGIAFKLNSNFSKRLSNSNELQTEIMKVYNKKTKSFSKPYIVIDFHNDENLHLSIGHGRVIYQLTNDGYIEGCLFDKYDFKFMMPRVSKDTENQIRIINDYAYTMNIINKLEYYYYTVPFKFKINQ